MAERKKTKILAVGDLHGDVRFAKRLAEKAAKENVDIVILAGDLTLAELSTKNIIGPFTRMKKQVLLIPGNHETVATADFLAELYAPYTKNIHGYSIRVGDVGIFGAGGANIGPFSTSEKEMHRLLNKAHENIKDLSKKIMVTHMHPKKSKTEAIGFEGSGAISKAIKKFRPDILLHGHIHETAGLEEKIGKTRVINVARKEVIFEI